jgi:hypothetical protein
MAVMSREMSEMRREISEMRKLLLQRDQGGNQSAMALNPEQQ